MKYQSYLDQAERKKWLDLEVTIGINPGWIEREMRTLSKFIREFDSLQKTELRQISSLDLPDPVTLTVTNKATLQLLLLKKFIDRIGLNIIKEARPGIGQSEDDIFVSLADDLFNRGLYPEDIYAYAVYRRRGSPTTWLSVSSEFDAATIETKVDEGIGKIIRSINYYMTSSRRLVATAKVNDLVIYLISKPTVPKVAMGEARNIEISGASFTLVVLDKTKKQVGVITGSKREIQIAQYNLRNKIFKNAMAIPRTDVKISGTTVLKNLLEQPEEPDSLVLQSLELKKTTLPEAPSLKIQVSGDKSIDEALGILTQYWHSSSISDLKRADFSIFKKKVGVYTYGDEWSRTCINTSTRNITSELEYAFLDQVKDRLGVSIKETRFILEDLTPKFILDKLVKDKLISTNPPIPEDAEKIVVELTKRKLIAKQSATIKRKCFNCYAISWDNWQCQNCDRSNMQIVSEAIKIEINEPAVMKALTKVSSFGQNYDLKYHPRKQRNKYIKSVTSVKNVEKNITSFLVLVSRRKDVSYVQSLVEEGFGIIAVMEPRVVGVKDELVAAGCSIVELSAVLGHLLDQERGNPCLLAIAEQEDSMLERIFERTRVSIARLTNKANYHESLFEIDLKNLVQALVPDVIRLGTEYSGTSVPDGYSRYGSNGQRSRRQGRRLFGWDAKYSRSNAYALSAADVAKQKKYIRWLSDPQNEPSQFGKLGIYAIISNFNSTRRMDKALKQVAEYRRLNTGTRVVLIEDMLLVKIAEWLLEHWQQVLENNSVIADVFFKWVRRKQAKPYTVSRASDWQWLKPKLDALL